MIVFSVFLFTVVKTVFKISMSTPTTPEMAIWTGAEVARSMYRNYGLVVRLQMRNSNISTAFFVLRKKKETDVFCKNVLSFVSLF